MRIPKPIFFLLPLFIAGCHGALTQTKKQAKSDTIRPGRKTIVKTSHPILTRDSTIINNEFSKDFLAFGVFKADTTKIKSLFLNPVSLKLEKQKDSEGNSYYLYDFTDGINKLSLYYNDGFYLEDGEIKNDKVLLNKKISIGMPKDDFLKLVNVVNIKRDTVIVKDDELSHETDYIFNNSKLKQVITGDIVE
jgi:hypothetical protein